MPTVLLAGASGDLGERIATALVARGATVRALTRSGASVAKTAHLESLGLQVVAADYADAPALRAAATGADVVVSALAGLRPVVLDAQTQLLTAAVSAGVPRFIPSDYSADYRRLPAGTNRNLELRREFMTRLDTAPLQATSVLVGAFADMLTGQAPLVLFGRGRVLYWHDADQPLDFTTKDDAAAFTAEAALDPTTPRFLEVAGSTVSSRDLARTMTELTGEPYKPQYAGGIGFLRTIARVGKLASRDRTALYPAWQGMQYFDTMFSGDGTLQAVDNDRYGVRHWTSAAEVLAAR
ncbi:NmrA family NAD(P)-binding protein [Modestobacter muralis]|uniref:NmrA family NAD(P)-binding protein n=1 Tax=Modestobacter muralis TaxID=1608614 RepID=A0A6P0H3V7_9ACTN|nr:NmrA family NAD(P)-binding protein [Modestobacter muralis]NEK93630.1 NmrA family NAD(P)-binding protein [Modestobacter muralis]NEN50397.1 NmrA family NAD(P)-binding protein [Modestobacter muralis]